MKKIFIVTLLVILLLGTLDVVFFILPADYRELTILTLAAFATVYYVIETNGMKREMVRQNEIHTQPYLLVYYRENEKRFTIRNAGNGIANKIEINDTAINFSEGGKIILKFNIADTRYLLPNEERELLVSGTDEEGKEITSEGFISFLINPNNPALDSGIQIRAVDISQCPYLFTIKVEKTGTYVHEIKKGIGNCSFD